MATRTSHRPKGGPRPLGRPRGCSTGKAPYLTKANALIAAAVKTKTYGRPMYAYWHGECGQYHVTHIESASVLRV